MLDLKETKALLEGLAARNPLLAAGGATPAQPFDQL